METITHLNLKQKLHLEDRTGSVDPHNRRRERGNIVMVEKGRRTKRDGKMGTLLKDAPFSRETEREWGSWLHVQLPSLSFSDPLYPSFSL